ADRSLTGSVGSRAAASPPHVDEFPLAVVALAIDLAEPVEQTRILLENSLDLPVEGVTLTFGLGRHESVVLGCRRSEGLRTGCLAAGMMGPSQVRRCNNVMRWLGHER